MRLSTSLMYQNGLKGILAQESDLNRLVEQSGSGRRVLSPADDPLAAAQAINTGQTASLNATYLLNRNTARQNLGIEENVLTSITNALQGVMTRVVEAGNGTYADTDRRTLATVLRTAREGLLGMANSTDGNGQYLFSGYQGDTVPYTADATGKIIYTGDTGQRTIQVDQSRQMSSSDVGSDIFNRATPGSRTYVTEAAASNAGTGVFGTASFMPGSANVGKDFTISFEDNAGVLSYRVTATDNTVTLPTSVTTPPAGSPPTVYESGTTIEMGGVSVAISGKPVPGDSFTVKTAQSTNVDIFATLDTLIAALEVPAQGDEVALAKLTNVLATANKKLSMNYDNALTVRASVGSRMAELEALDATGSQKGLAYAKELSNLEDLDYYQTASQLALRQVALKAASSAFMTIQGSSLFSRS